MYLVRHGSHDEVGRVLSGRSTIALNDTGRGEAARLAVRLSAVPIARVETSPRPRAQETAAILAESHGLKVDIVDALDEIDFGAWTGRDFADLDDDPAWHLWNAERGRAATPGGETMGAAVMRARRHLDALDRDGAKGAVLCVSHCDVIRGVVASYLGLDLDRMLGFDCDPASLTTIALEDGGARLVALNERAA